MLFIVSAVLGGLVGGGLLGGSLRRLEQLPLHRVRVLVAAVAVQLLASELLGGAAYVTALVLSLALAAGFLLVNPHLAGRGLLLGGLALNALVIAVNGAMPVQLGAARRAGVSVNALLGDPRHALAGPRTHLAVLGDRFPLALPWQPQVLSIGDILVAAGAAMLVSAAMRRGTGLLVPVPRRPPAAADDRPGAPGEARLVIDLSADPRAVAPDREVAR